MNSLDSSVLKLVDCYWAQFFGCTPETLRTDTPQIVASSGSSAYAGCYLMEFGGAPVVSLPVDEPESSRVAIEQWRAGVVRRPAIFQAIFGERIAARIGPAHQIWGEQIAHIAIVAHPTFRGQGYATAAVSVLTQNALERMFVPQYRTLEGNAPAMAIARRLGFVHYATSLALRFA